MTTTAIRPVIAPDDKDRKAWHRLPWETPKQYAAFRHYRELRPAERSIRRAYEIGTPAERQKETTGNNNHWNLWSQKNDWVNRAAAYDEYVAEVDRLRWEERRLQVKKRDYEQGERLRHLIDQVLDVSQDFVTETRQFIPGSDGTPDREVIRQAIDMPTVLKMIEVASKVQRLATGETTENTGVSLVGEVLDRVLEKEINRAKENVLLEDPDIIDIDAKVIEEFGDIDDDDTEVIELPDEDE